MKGKIITKFLRPRLVHAIAMCDSCDWRYEDYLGNFIEEAKKHTKQTGHSTTVETGYFQNYFFEQEKNVTI